MTNQRPPKPNFLALGGAVVLPLLASIGVMFVVPQFAELSRGFGADLPVETRVLLSTYPWWGALILPIVALWWYEWKNAKNQMMAVVFGAFAGGALLLFGVWACYSPVMRLAAIE